jgi:hypothetical protein
MGGDNRVILRDLDLTPIEKSRYIFITGMNLAGNILFNDCAKSITLDNNRIKTLPIFKKELEYLSVKNNLLEDVPLHFGVNTLLCCFNLIKRLTRLHHNIINLICRHNVIKEIKIPRYCRILDASSNKLSKVPKITDFLETINLSNNNITTFDFGKNNNVREINISTNKIKKISYCPSNLRTLFCSGNSLRYMNLNKNIQTLYCSSNKFVSLRLKRYTKLTNLIANDNNLVLLSLPKNIKNVHITNKHKKLRYILPIKKCKEFYPSKKFIDNSAAYVLQCFFIRIFYLVTKRKGIIYI